MAVDFSKVALAKARIRNFHLPHVRFAQANLLNLRLDRKFPVIVCSEILCYIHKRFAPTVLARLDEHLAEYGILVYLTGLYRDGGWLEILSSCFRKLADDSFPEGRPHRIVVFSRNTERSE